MAVSISVTVRSVNPAGAGHEVVKTPYRQYFPASAITYKPYVGNDSGSYSLVQARILGREYEFGVAETVATIVAACNA